MVTSTLFAQEHRVLARDGSGYLPLRAGSTGQYRRTIESVRSDIFVAVAAWS